MYATCRTIASRAVSRLRRYGRRLSVSAGVVDPVVPPDLSEFVSTKYGFDAGWLNKTTGEVVPGLNIRAEDTVVDVGCGPGFYSSFAGELGAEVIGIDIDSSAVEKLKQRMSTVPARSFRAMVSDCNPLPLPAQCASVVLAMEMLEHVDDPAAVLAELVRIGKPDARYLIAVPAELSQSVMKKVAPGVCFRKPNHVRIFSEEQLEAAVQSAGLVIEQRARYGFYWSMWWALRWAVDENDIPFGRSGHSPILKAWNKTYHELLSSPQGRIVWKALDEAMPNSFLVIARKPLDKAA